jgi:hypothetical protein
MEFAVQMNLITDLWYVTFNRFKMIQYQQEISGRVTILYSLGVEGKVINALR